MYITDCLHVTSSVVSKDLPPSSGQDAPPPLPSLPVAFFPGPVGARLGDFWLNWQHIGAEDWVVQVLRGGYYLPFGEELPPLTASPPELSYGPSHALFQELQDQVQKLLDKRAIEPVLDQSPGFYSRLFLAPKKSGEWRPVIDLSTLNGFIITPKFKMETVQSIMASIQPNMWCTSLDLQDAFMHIPVARRHRKYLRFMVRGRAFQFRALPFGLTTSPYVFTRVVKAVGSYVRSRGLSIIQYLDDWNISCKSFDACKLWTTWLLSLTRDLGLLVNLLKSDLDPAQLFQFIGILFDLIRGTARPADHRIEAFLKLAEKFLSQAAPKAESWQQILGHMTSLERLVPRGRLHMRPLQFQLQLLWSQHEDLQSRPVPLNAECKLALSWWMDRAHLLQGVPLKLSLPQVTLFTDASTDGWGAHVGDLQVGGRWSVAQRELHINNLELLAVLLALEHFKPQVQNSLVMVMTDNTTVVGQIRNQGGTHSRELFDLTVRLFEWADLHRVTLVPRHIPGRLNVIADRLSRQHQVIHTEWSLSPVVARQVWRVWGQPHVDMFATSENAKLPVYVSPLPDPLAWRIDALSFSWDGLWMFLFPPVPLLMEVLQRISFSQCDAILIAPAWPTQGWFTLLLELCVDHPRELPLMRSLLRQPGTGTFHLNLEMLHLHAWRLSGPLSRARATQRTWLAESPRLTGTLHRPSTTVAGESSVIGVLNTGTILSTSLPLS